MRFMTTYAFAPDHRDETIARFKATLGAPPMGVTLLGRWHDVGGNHGFALSETDDIGALYKWILEWSDLIDFQVTPVLDDEEFGAAIEGIG